jgi:hypothetical protein
MCKNFNNKKALLIWRDIEMNEENINNITCKDYQAPNGFSNFVNFSILYKNRDLDEYRVKYLKKTGQPWQKATIQDIYKAELVWGF